MKHIISGEEIHLPKPEQDTVEISKESAGTPRSGSRDASELGSGEWEYLVCESCNWGDYPSLPDTCVRLYQGEVICLACAEFYAIEYGDLEEINV